jgi:voltage-gated potassium channel
MPTAILPYARTATIKTLNSIYLWVSIVSAATIAVYERLLGAAASSGLYVAMPYVAVISWSYFLLSRNNEVFYAFLMDAFDKMSSSKNGSLPKGRPPSTLTARDRITLSLKSYLELILNFAMLYALTAKSFWKDGRVPVAITDAIYFSGITITTTGYGDITPCHWYPQFLSIYEVFCGVLLLVVCFAIYAGRLDRTSA